MLKVGHFIYDNGVVSGPAEYMREQGSAKLRDIEAGNSAVVNYGLMHGKGSVEQLVLVALQTDYAGWRGTKSLLGGK